MGEMWLSVVLGAYLPLSGTVHLWRFKSKPRVVTVVVWLAAAWPQKFVSRDGAVRAAIFIVTNAPVTRPDGEVPRSLSPVPELMD